MRTLWTVAAAVGLAVLAPAAPALAHNELTGAAPAADSVLVKPPAEVRLTFADRLSSLVTVVVTGPDRQRVEAARPAVERTTATVRFVRPLPNGAYTVAYRVVSNDGHTIQGAYGFRVAAPVPATTPALTAPAPATTATTVAPTTPAPVTGSSTTGPTAIATLTPAEATEDGGTGTGTGTVALIAVPMAAVAAGAVVLARRRRTG